ncbi:MAG: glycosyltransferase, partial [Woeseiaceae bacterium]
ARDLPNVIFAGQVSDVHHYLAAFDIFAFPSRHEGLGSTLLDAMAAELPIAASITGGIPDIIRHGENGLLVEPDDESGWLTAIDQLIKDGPQQLKFANANRQRISEFSAEAMGLRYHALYARLFS